MKKRKIWKKKGSLIMTQDMTQGKIMPMLVHFTIPLVLGNLFQLTYNAVDSIIVGHFVGKEALAAVGICNPITTLFILFLNGLCMGASILIGMYYGAKDEEKLARQMSTTMLAGLTHMSLKKFVWIILLGKPLSLIAYSYGLTQLFQIIERWL